MGSKEKRILIIDDAPSVRRLLKKMVTEFGYNAFSSKGGKKTLSFMRRCRPDMVLLDYSMPGLDGIELCRRIRENSTFKRVPIIIVTAVKGEVEDKVSGFQVGADDYLTKPFSWRELQYRIEVLFRRSKKLIPEVKSLTEQTPEVKKFCLLSEKP